MERLLVIALALFIATNVDVLLVLIAFCLDVDYGTIEIGVGYAMGVVVGIGGALLGAFVLTGLFANWAFLLGVIPFGLGVWGFIRREPDLDQTDPHIVPGRFGRVGVVAVASIGLNGENLAVYVPFFLERSSGELLAIVVLYLAGAAALFAIAVAVANRSYDYGHPAWIDRWLVPAILVIVGTYVLVSGWIAA